MLPPSSTHKHAPVPQSATPLQGSIDRKTWRQGRPREAAGVLPRNVLGRGTLPQLPLPETRLELLEKNPVLPSPSGSGDRKVVRHTTCFWPGWPPSLHERIKSRYDPALFPSPAGVRIPQALRHACVLLGTEDGTYILLDHLGAPIAYLGDGYCHFHGSLA